MAKVAEKTAIFRRSKQRDMQNILYTNKVMDIKPGRQSKLVGNLALMSQTYKRQV